MSWRSKSYDELPALTVRRGELRRSLRVVTAAYMFFIVFQSCTSGSHIPVFVTMLGFKDWHYGVLTAIPCVATFAQLLGSVFIERSGLKKYQFITCGVIHRLLVAVAFIPLVFRHLPCWGATWTMLLIVMISQVLNHLATPAWLTWMGDLIPKPVRGRYFANRQMYSRPVQIVSAIALGVVLDWATRQGVGETAAGQPRLLAVICGLFVVAGLFGATDILLFLRVREVVPRHIEPNVPVLHLAFSKPRRWTLLAAIRYYARLSATATRQLLLDPLKDRVFLHYVGYGAMITFAMTVTCLFFWQYGMEVLGFSKLAANIQFLVVAPVLGLIGAHYWGRLIDHWGRRPVLIVATVMTTLSVTPWFFAMRNTPAPAFVTHGVNWVLHGIGHWVGWSDGVALAPDAPTGAYLLATTASVIGGIAWTGVTLAQYGIMLGFADRPGRSKYIAASNVLLGFGGALGGLVGGGVAQGLHYFHNHPVSVGPFLWDNWHATFLLSFLARIASLAWLVHMPDPGSRDVRNMVRSIGGDLYSLVSAWMLLPLRVFGWGHSDDDSPRPRSRARRG